MPAKPSPPPASAPAPSASRTPQVSNAPAHLVRKLGRRDAHWQKAEVLRLVHFVRHAVALLLGIVFGALPLFGAPALLVYAVATLLAPSFVLKRILALRLEEIDGGGGETEEGEARWQISTEALWPSLLFFVLVWTTVYSTFRAPAL